MVCIAAIQSSFLRQPSDNLAHADSLVRQAAAAGAQVILLPELFERPYFCKTQREEFLHYALPVDENPAVLHLQKLAAELSCVLPVSFYERSGQVRFNSLAMIDADGSVLGVYRKSHIPDGLGYQEKFYFTPGDSGFRVWQTRYGCIGVGICWDQWFPEAARAMALAGAELLLYPTAIGSEPQNPLYDSSAHWQLVMRGHAAANLVPVIAANRVGDEQQNDALGNKVQTSFYGRSFIADEYGNVVADGGNEDGVILYSEFDCAAINTRRAAWGLFRDRRPDLYTPLTQHSKHSSSLV
ncbi:MAG: N-carbamoylputrescine amidase [Proteobacteria bacterium]|nr:N-carbamoylputrescine amidase [Pseudomonadota bacterium]